MNGNFLIENYFRIGYLNYFYNQKPSELTDFWTKVRVEVQRNKFRGITFIGGLLELEKNFSDLKLFSNKRFSPIQEMIHNRASLEVYFSNLVLLEKFFTAKRKPSEQEIRKFLLDNFDVSDCGAILSNHAWFKNTEFYKRTVRGTWRLGLTREPKEFVSKHFNELFLNDEGYALGIFIFLDGLVKKFGLTSKFGVFKEIYLKGKEIISREYSEKELQEVVRYFKEKQKESEDFL